MFIPLHAEYCSFDVYSRAALSFSHEFNLFCAIIFRLNIQQYIPDHVDALDLMTSFLSLHHLLDTLNAPIGTSTPRRQDQ